MPTDEEKEYEIWVEGYLATGMEGIPQKASLVAKVRAKSFREACAKHYGLDDPSFNPNVPSYWGCHLYDNEEDARRSWG